MASKRPSVDRVAEIERDLNRLKWWTILAPILFLMLLEAARRVIGPGFDESWPGYLLLAGIVALGALAFSEIVFRVVTRLEDRTLQQNHELLALNASALDILGELDLDLLLQRVVDEARSLVGARYGALSVVGEDGDIEQFLTSGIDPERRAMIGHPPQGRGLLGVPLRQGERLILDNLADDPRSVGFPDHHPPMRSLLAVPVEMKTGIIGNLYLSERLDGASFNTGNAETLERIATLAALAIENARLHREIHGEAIAEERGRIAHEMHDTIAQVLGYVNTKAQAVETLLSLGKQDRAQEQLEQLAVAAREAYADVRENVLSLRASSGGERDFCGALRSYLERWQEMSGIRVNYDDGCDVVERSSMEPVVELQLLRIIQEALTNVRKHARTDNVTLRFTGEPGQLEAVIEDEGRGIDSGDIGTSGVPRFGLATMRERAEAVGGSLTVSSGPNGGTVVRARVPIGRDAMQGGMTS